jgi:hypothetical protein
MFLSSQDLPMLKISSPPQNNLFDKNSQECCFQNFRELVIFKTFKEGKFIGFPFSENYWELMTKKELAMLVHVQYNGMCKGEFLTMPWSRHRGPYAGSGEVSAAGLWGWNFWREHLFSELNCFFQNFTLLCNRSELSIYLSNPQSIFTSCLRSIIYLSVIYLLIHPSTIYQSIYLPIYLSVYPSIYLPFHLPIHSSIHPSSIYHLYPSIHPFYIYHLTIYHLSISLSISVTILPVHSKVDVL